MVADERVLVLDDDAAVLGLIQAGISQFDGAVMGLSGVVKQVQLGDEIKRVKTAYAGDIANLGSGRPQVCQGG